MNEYFAKFHCNFVDFYVCLSFSIDQYFLGIRKYPFMTSKNEYHISSEVRGEYMDDRLRL